MPEQDGGRPEFAPDLAFSAQGSGSSSSGFVIEKGFGLALVRLNAGFGKEKPAGVIEKLFKSFRPAYGQMATFVVAALVHELLDTSLADMLSTNGKVHFEAARDTLAEVPAETSARRKREKIVIAEAALREAYRYHAEEAEVREGAPLAGRRAMVTAHRHAAEAAVYIASIDRHLDSDKSSLTKWTDRATDHFERYATHALAASENQATLGSAAMGASAGTVVALTVLTGGLAALMAAAVAMSMGAGFSGLLAEKARLPAVLEQERLQLETWRRHVLS